MNDEFAQFFLPGLEFDDTLFTSLSRQPSIRSVSDNSEKPILITSRTGSDDISVVDDTVFPDIRGVRTSHYSSLVPLEASEASPRTRQAVFHQDYDGGSAVKYQQASSTSTSFPQDLWGLSFPPSQIYTPSSMTSISQWLGSDSRSPIGLHANDSNASIRALDEIGMPIYQTSPNQDSLAKNRSLSAKKLKNVTETSNKSESCHQKGNPLALKTVPPPSVPQLINVSGEPVFFSASGNLDGRFYSSNKYLATSKKDEFPIACYRRNYIVLETVLEFSDLPHVLICEDGSRCKVRSIKMSVSSSSNFSSSPVDLSLFINHKKSIKAPQGLQETLMESSTIALDPSKGKQKIVLNRFQFKKATPNNGKRVIKDYYYLDVRIDLVVLGSDGIEKEASLTMLKSNAISVRGRNPSFYNDKMDIFIKEDEHGKTLRKRLSKPLVPQKVTEENKTPQNITLKIHSRYKYFPIKSNYYLPPLRAYYLPHSAAHREVKVDDLRLKRRMSNVPTYNFFIRRKDKVTS
ncbi:hypothetical protein FOA43_001977 [Brettanomyces nanus]|uniref:NDT80 domain-containing protein n=1 Tax=Eeniella nana TaxID=13502 RepID=A0A875S2S3_EENNA|nr:uncharacterized protein FOA43_001977 [Brettanomyces nanus]QPG74645.1 hypothetical protein FOA43_001977 [Brettanomyces nanus]